ncbi:MAG: acyl-ACP--UDP-N-acetylglucosamine O-acyltransferase [Deltaproteobacteria bacterium]|nr:acyl-ACP--UDP-N-acetylglucosamine O-acyltransferase [Deltaproteobacteria bacterium]
MIHPTAIVSNKAKIGKNVEIGPYSYIGEEVEIGDGTRIGNNVIIEDYTAIGGNCNIFHHAVLGTVPQDINFKEGEETRLVIGDNNVIREFVMINRGTKRGGGITRIGNGNFIMAYVHIAHDCMIGNNVIMANMVQLAGHVMVEDFACMGGLAAVHQFVRIGAYSMIGGVSGVSQDVLPYILVAGNRAKPCGINIVGLRRHGFSEEDIRTIKRAYKTIFHSHLLLKEIIKELEKEESPYIKKVLEFMRSSKRGFCK